MRVLTKEQRQAIKRKFDQCSDGATSYLAFRRRAVYPYYDECVMLPWCGMWLGIEPDGYTHS